MKVAPRFVRVGLSRFGVDVGHDDVGALSRKHRCVREAQPGGCAGDHDDLVFHSIHILIHLCCGGVFGNHSLSASYFP